MLFLLRVRKVISAGLLWSRWWFIDLVAILLKHINLCRSVSVSLFLHPSLSFSPSLSLGALFLCLWSRLELLLDQAVLEVHENGDLGAVLQVAVLQHADHAVAVHGLAGEELQVLEAAQNVLGRLVHVGLEGVHLVGVFLRQRLHDPESNE